MSPNDKAGKIHKNAFIVSICAIGRVYIGRILTSKGVDPRPLRTLSN